MKAESGGRGQRWNEPRLGLEGPGLKSDNFQIWGEPKFLIDQAQSRLVAHLGSILKA